MLKCLRCLRCGDGAKVEPQWTLERGIGVLRDGESESRLLSTLAIVTNSPMDQPCPCRILETRRETRDPKPATSISSPGDTRPMAGNWASVEVPPGRMGLAPTGIAGGGAISAEQPGKSWIDRSHTLR